MKVTTIISFILVLIGAIVWFMVGAFNFNLVSFIFQNAGQAGLIASRVIYAIVGVAGLWMIFYWIIYKPFKKM